MLGRRRVVDQLLLRRVATDGAERVGLLLGDLGRVGAPTALEIEVLPDGVIQQAHGRLSVTSAGAGWRGTRRAPVRQGQPALIVRFLPARLAW